MSEHGSPDDLKSLGERLDKARRDRTGPAADDGKRNGALEGSALGLGFRIGLELVVAVVFGLGVGWAIDRWLGTKPWAMLAFLLLGIAAGMLSVYKAMTGMGSAVGYGSPNRPAASSEDEREED
jgi:ATP synthase protein I